MTEHELLEIAERVERWYHDEDRPMFPQSASPLFRTADRFAEDIGNLLSFIGALEARSTSDARNWLCLSLEDAARRTAALPRWAVDLDTAMEQGHTRGITE